MAQSMMSVSDPEDYVVCTSNKGTRAYTIDTTIWVYSVSG